MYPYIVPQFGSFSPFISLFSLSWNDFNWFQCKIFIHVSKVLQPYSSSFILFIYHPLPTITLPLTWPILHSYPSLFYCLVIVQWGFLCLGILRVNTLYFSQSNLLYYSSLSLPPTPTDKHFSVHSVVSCSYTNDIYFNVFHYLSFFSSSPSLH
jgi:hypothetical protein